MESLSKRREALSLKFATKASKHPIHKQWFELYHGENRTRIEKPTYKPVLGRTERLLKSAIPFLTNLLNKKNNFGVQFPFNCRLVDYSLGQVGPNQCHQIIVQSRFCTDSHHLILIKPILLLLLSLLLHYTDMVGHRCDS